MKICFRTLKLCFSSSGLAVVDLLSVVIVKNCNESEIFLHYRYVCVVIIEQICPCLCFTSDQCLLNKTWIAAMKIYLLKNVVTYFLSSIPQLIFLFIEFKFNSNLTHIPIGWTQRALSLGVRMRMRKEEGKEWEVVWYNDDWTAKC